MEVRKFLQPRMRWQIVMLLLLQFLFRFSQGQGPGYSFSVQEELGPGTQVGTIQTQLGTTYEFAPNSTGHKYFVLSSSTGQITTKTVIDREAVKLQENKLFFLILAKDSQGSHPVEVAIEILDINDNSPTFPSEVVKVEFQENVPVSTAKMISTATDLDDGDNALVSTYRLISGDGPFQIVYDPVLYGQVLMVETTGLLDRETRESYSLTVVAYDSGSPRKSGTAVVQISIIDMNDNPPLFEPSTYDAKVNETDVNGTFVIQVVASDRDIGVNSDLTYKFVATDSASSQFRIEKRTGKIFTHTTPLLCDGPCVLTVEARDGGNPSYPGRAFVYISVKDNNNHDPVIRFQYIPIGTTNWFSTVNEDAGSNTMVAAVTVEDADTGFNGETTIKIIAGNELQHFITRQLTNIIYVFVSGDGLFDRERNDVYNITFQAQDKGSPPRKSVGHLVIHINDINEFPPEFQQKNYRFELSETTPVHSFVANLHAVDRDSGINAKLIYTILNDQPWFNINKYTGLVTVKQRLHYNVQNIFQMNVSVHDGASFPLYDYAQLVVSIWDENDIAPQFSKVISDITLAENLRSGAPVVIASAMDLDSGKNGTIRYSFHPDVEILYPGTFHVNTDTGSVTTTRSLDREETEIYKLHVIASDQGMPALSSMATVNLQVTDVNDNSPIFYPTTYYATVLENQQSSVYVTTVIATDIDLAENAEVVYSISGSNFGKFEVDSASGILKTTGSLSKSDRSSYVINIAAKDKPGKAATNQATVNVMVISASDQPPYFTNILDIRINITEDTDNTQSLVGNDVHRVNARTDQFGTAIMYSISGGDPQGYFRIDQSLGWIKRNKDIDREVTRAFELTVLASTGAQFASTFVNITVLDINDNSPVFSRSSVTVKVVENRPVGHHLVLIQATDIDEGVNARVSYTLKTDPNNVFAIVSETGLLYLNKPVSALLSTNVMLVVTATDSGTPQFSANQELHIELVDVNDNTPKFDRSMYEVSLNESHAVNDRFFHLVAMDDDVGQNSQIQYNITRGNEDSNLGLFPDGSLYITKELDRERKDLYKLSVIATDRGIPQRSSECNITIHITDTNDNKPIFDNATYHLQLMENSPENTIVGFVRGKDYDMGRNAELFYFFVVEQNNFTIDSQTGQIRSMRSFDREELVSLDDTFTFDVVVKDNGISRLQDIATVRVTILDENDNKPVFAQSPYQVNILESAPFYANVTVAKATDADSGINSIVTYQIIEGNEEDKFEIDPITGQITVKGILDRETDDLYKLKVKATDSGSMVKYSTEGMVHITILDINDNTPLFATTSMEITVKEDVRPGTKVAKFSATDVDLSMNGKVSYSISGSNGTFMIDSHTGDIYTSKDLDFETVSNYNLNVTASDFGSPSLSSNIRFQIKVEDINDNKPVLHTEGKVYRVTEGNSGSVGIVTATDADSNENGEIKFGILYQDPPGDNFKIVEQTGEIYISRAVDREISDMYNLTVTAVDQAYPPKTRLTSETIIPIFIDDQNDNTPMFLSVTSIKVPQTISGSTKVTTIETYDPDSGQNGRVGITLQEGQRSLFVVDANGGFFLNGSLPSNPVVYPVKLRATDYGLQQRYQDQVFTVIVMGTDGGPQFQGSSYSGALAENSPVGKSIVQVRAVSSRGSRVDYYVTSVVNSDSGLDVSRFFQVDKDTGIVSPAVVMDRETTGGNFKVQICAVDTTGDKPRTQTTQVQVQVTDLNDTPPRFHSNFYRKNIREDVIKGAVVARVEVSDDEQFGNVFLNISSGNDGSFKLHQDGSLATTRLLDRETTSQYTLRIYATDGVQSSSCLVRINVLDINDNSPTFQQDLYSFDVPENTPVDTVIGVVQAIDGDLGNSGAVTYFMTSDWSNQIFDLDPVKGTFTLRGVVDFEQNELYTLVIGARDAGIPTLTSTVVVYFNIKDVNDNTPLFDPVSYDREISESVAPDTSIVQVYATDIDSGVNGQISYSLDSRHGNAFYINADNGIIYANSSLDRETTPTYTLTVYATDKAAEVSDQKTGEAQVSIGLRDINDFTPEFVSAGTTHVKENLAWGTIVHTITTRDLDLGINGQVEYSLGASPSGNPFTIGKDDGKLRVNTNLDRETTQNYTMIIVATDRGSPRLSATQTLVIKIADENDNNPVFSPEFYSDEASEDIPIGTTLLSNSGVSATDIDAGLNGIVRYFIIGGDDNNDFSIDQSSGVLRVQKSLDYERVQMYSLIIQAEDSGSDVKMATATVNITVRDVNDNVPVFLDYPYLAYALENRTSGAAHILQVSARDDDSAPFDDLRYYIREGDRTLFNMSEKTGEIMLLRTLDREQQSEYRLTVIAKDSFSGDALTGTGTVTIYVEDINDNPPVFQNPDNYVTHVRENAVPDTEVITVLATDLDEGINAQLIYSLRDSIDNRFTIYADTGRIATLTQLDREERDVYTLEVIVRDASILPLSATTTVWVYVDDENDNVPTFDKDMYNHTVLPPAGSGAFVLGVTAVDKDIGDNGLVVYSLSPSNQNFNLNPATGVITASQSLTAGQTYQLLITASDRGTPAKTSTVSASVYVATSSPTVIPQFNPIPTNVKVSEDSKPGYSVTTVTAGLSNGNPISYHIVGGNIGHAFSIDSNSGRLTVSGVVDYETATSYHLWIQATVVNNEAVWNNAEIVLEIEDVNDNSPRFTERQTSVEVEENNLYGALLTTVKATDPDSENSGQVTYSLEGEDKGDFGILLSGKINILTNLDRESKDLYNLIIVATDNGSPRLTTTTSISVVVKDLNDNSPKFNRLYNVKVPENAAVGSFVIQVASADADIGDNAIAHYSLEDNAQGRFAMDEMSGNITLQKPLDAEVIQTFILIVLLSDGSHTVRTNLEISVTDVNDNTPSLLPPYTFDFPEQQPAGTVVGVLSATDSDQTSPNNKVYFSLKLPSSQFNLFPDNGTITSLEEMEYQPTSLALSQLNQHELVVLVKDLGTPSRSSEVSIFINIVDFNNHAPVFSEGSYQSPVPLNAAVDRSVLTVEARDEYDYGMNAEVEYFATSGTGLPYFKVDRFTGLVSVSRSLLVHVGSQLQLIITAKDRGLNPQSATTQLTLIITDINRETPQFVLPVSRTTTIPENTQTGYTMTRFSAVDSDSGLNGEVVYDIITGNDHALFSLDGSGQLTVAATLDYETERSHVLTVQAKDRGLLFKTSTVVYTIQLTDINDNDPVFKKSEESVYVSESSMIGTPVFQALATDADDGDNKIIHYAIVGNTEAQRVLTINPSTGNITLKAALDYETKKSYTANVMAMNLNDNVRKSILTLTVEVEGANEFVPKFRQSVYYFNADESDGPGTLVGTVYATDEDDGQDGVVYYFLIGESNNLGFKVNPRTGEITVNDKLDYESANSISLEVLVKNWGSIKGNDTDTCTVNIKLKDSNDAPVFTENVYNGRVLEGSGNGVSILSVSATDLDVEPRDRNFSYVILAGNDNNLFTISETSGEIWTTGQGNLDRETVPVYNITVGAIDKGLQPQTGSAQVLIHLDDINDNGPVFTSFVAEVPENQAAGFVVTVLTQFTTDPDGPGNGFPFTYSKIPTNANEYISFDINDITGQVVTRQVLDREAQDTYLIPVIVMDGGNPKMSSSLTFTVKVTDNNDSPPEARLLTAFIAIFNGQISSKPVADVRPSDLDLVGDYSCSLMTVNQPFFIPSASCDLILNSNPVSNSYKLTLNGSDGSQYQAATYDVSIKISAFDNITLEHSTVIRLRDVSRLHFVENLYSSFVSACQQAFNPLDSITVFGLQPISDDLLVFMSVKKDTGNYYSSEELHTRLQNSVNSLNTAVVVDVSFDNCSSSLCLNNGRCASLVVVTGDVILTNTSHRSFAHPEVGLDIHCECLPQFSGPDCGQQATKCGNTYCQNGGLCVVSDAGSMCQCLDSWTGSSCEMDVDECNSSPCENGATCQNTHGDFLCICQDGFSNTLCEDGFDYCQPSPCENSGTCRNVDGNFQCSCPYGYWGNRCEHRSIGFNVGSFLESPPMGRSVNEIEVVFTTNKQNSLLMYNPALERTSKEFIALEIINSQIRFSVALGTQAPTRVTIPVNVTDGNWFKVKINRNRFTSSVWVSKCPQDGSPCQECEAGTACYSQGNPQGNETLEVGTQPLSIGGVRDISLVTDRPGQVSTHDFVGCIRSFIVNTEDQLVGSMSEQLGYCPRSSSISSCNSWVCQNGGSCVDLWYKPSCQCTTKFAGPHCEQELKPFGFGQNGRVMITMKESYRRDELVSQGNRVRRSLSSESRVLIRFRTTEQNGLLLFTSTKSGNRFNALSVIQGQLQFSAGQFGAVSSTEISSPSVADGKWHNASVILKANEISLVLDKQHEEKTTGDAVWFSDLDVKHLSLGGAENSITIDNIALKDFSGCISVLEIDGRALPLNGSTDQYNIEPSSGDSIENGCSSLCAADPCGGGACTVEGELAVCSPTPSKGNPALSIGVIVVIAFFGVLIIVIIVLFLMFRYRRHYFKCIKEEKYKANGNPMAKSVNSSGHSHQDSGFGENQIDEMIIRNHIQQELGGSHVKGMNGRLMRPDIIESELTGRSQLPLDLEDGTVIIDNASDLTHLRDLNGDVPEHYDLENASSIAPSDIDVIDHYRQFHKSSNHRRKNKAAHSAHSSHQYSSHSSSHHAHSVPNNLSSVPYFNDVPRNSPAMRASPAMRNSPINQLSRQSPNIRNSPLTHVNMRGMPITDLNTGTSDHSMTSHHSHHSSNPPHKPKRQMLPNGNAMSKSPLVSDKSKRANNNYDKKQFLTLDEVNHLNSRPRESPASLMEAVSSSSENNARKKVNPMDHYRDTSVLLEPPLSSSDDSANDSFTCSEFEFENEKPRNDFDANNRIFSNLPEVENENDEGAYHNKTFKADGLDSVGNSFSSNVGSSDEGLAKIKPINGTFNWDDLLNWGPKFEKLVGVFTDIALLPDGESGEIGEIEGKSTDKEEYV